MARSVKAFILYLFLPFVLYPQSPDIKFDHISVEQGLSHTMVNCIFQDSRGFLWIGTKDGLNRYDGFSFVKYTSNSFDTGSISNNYVNAVCEDPSHTGLWIGTNSGLNFSFTVTWIGERYLPFRQRGRRYFWTEIAVGQVHSLHVGQCHTNNHPSDIRLPFAHDRGV